MNDHEFTGIANATGVIDRGGDVIAPGAFADVLAEFLRSGFISLAHNWDVLPVAWPVTALETAEGLRVTGRFHSTPSGDAARKVVAERLGAGLDVGLSIGFRSEAADCVGFRSGPEMLAYAIRNDIGGLDEVGIYRWRAPCRLVRRVAELFEVSIVAVPMNPRSRVTGDVVSRARQELGAALALNRMHLALAQVQWDT